VVVKPIEKLDVLLHFLNTKLGQRGIIFCKTKAAVNKLEIAYVVNYHLPDTYDAYVHRTGRTARAGAKGLAITILQQEEVIDIADFEDDISSFNQRRINRKSISASVKANLFSRFKIN